MKIKNALTALTAALLAVSVTVSGCSSGTAEGEEGVQGESGAVTAVNENSANTSETGENGGNASENGEYGASTSGNGENNGNASENTESGAGNYGNSENGENGSAASASENNRDDVSSTESSINTPESNGNGVSGSENNGEGNSDWERSTSSFPEMLAEIPDRYWQEAEQKGTLEDLYYDTYESFSYEEKSQKLQKHAIVYLPYGYDESKKYPVFYLMHGGWSNETVYLGSTNSPARMKNVLDNGLADGEIAPMIVVCPTYNNTSPEDSGSYSLALRLTDNYHNELVNDLIPAVEGKYSTYAENTDLEGIEASRDYRAFAGFSMGSMATWRTFEHSLDYFRYFMPSSGGPPLSAEEYERIVEDAGRKWEDFFIFAASGTADFAYSGFKSGIDRMKASSKGIFRFADNERDGNLYYLESDGDHSGAYAMMYFYNGLRWIWK